MKRIRIQYFCISFRKQIYDVTSEISEDLDQIRTVPVPVPIDMDPYR